MCLKAANPPAAAPGDCGEEAELAKAAKAPLTSDLNVLSLKSSSVWSAASLLIRCFARPLTALPFLNSSKHDSHTSWFGHCLHLYR